MLVHPDQHFRLAVEMRDEFARGALRKMFQERRSDVHVPEIGEANKRDPHIEASKAFHGSSAGGSLSSGLCNSSFCTLWASKQSPGFHHPFRRQLTTTANSL